MLFRSRIEVAGEAEWHVRPNDMGTGIWWTTPVLLWLFVDLRRILRDPRSAALLFGAMAVAVGLLFFHGTGFRQRGFNRFSLDYLPVLLTVIAPLCIEGRRRWITLGMVAWSVAYFRWLI